MSSGYWKGDQVLIFMRWDDTWGQADCDLDLQLYESKLGPDGKYPLFLGTIFCRMEVQGKTPSLL